jgi:ectoine hydroxylase-related dioxygenase (phytanoyl-CoA dioxygenase family)
MKKYEIKDETIIIMSLRITNCRFSQLNDHLRNNFLFKTLGVKKPSNSNIILEKTLQDVKKNYPKALLSKRVKKNKFNQIKKMINLDSDLFLSKNQFEILSKKKLPKEIYNKKTFVKYLDELIIFFFIKNKILLNNLPEFIAYNNKSIKNQKNKFLRDGYLVINKFFNLKTTNKLSKCLKKIESKQDKAKKGYFYGKENKFRRVYNLIGQDKFFSETILDNKYLMALLNSIFDINTLHDKFFLSSAQSNTLYPKAEKQIWHIDSNMPEPVPKWITRMQLAIALDDFKKNNGSTEIVPFSHRFAKHPKNKMPKFIKKILCKKGSIIMWHGNVWHRSTENNSKNSRTAILCCFSNSVLRQVSTEDNYLRIIDRKKIKKLSDNTKNLIGYNHGIL